MENTMIMFPNYFSQSVVNSILKYGKQDDINAYRVSKYGRDFSVAFLNYYDEVLLGYKIVRNKEKYLENCKNDIDKLSVSCYFDEKDAIYYLNITLKEQFPEKVMLQGVTSKEYGLCQITKERKTDIKKSHIDWWLYKDATPWEVFKEVRL